MSLREKDLGVAEGATRYPPDDRVVVVQEDGGRLRLGHREDLGDARLAGGDREELEVVAGPRHGSLDLRREGRAYGENDPIRDAGGGEAPPVERPFDEDSPARLARHGVHDLTQLVSRCGALWLHLAIGQDERDEVGSVMG